jgi:hypothetical protein
MGQGVSASCAAAGTLMTQIIKTAMPIEYFFPDHIFITSFSFLNNSG